jgi:hypothetical protein
MMREEKATKKSRKLFSAKEQINEFWLRSWASRLQLLDAKETQ